MDYPYFRAQVSQLAETLLRREPLSSEVAYWSQLLGAGASLADVSREIRNSHEFRCIRRQEEDPGRDKKRFSW